MRTSPIAAPPIIDEEIDLLQSVRTHLLETPEGPGASEREVVGELVRLREDLSCAKGEDVAAMHQQMGHLSALLDQIRRGRKTTQVDPDSPYFGHLQLEEGNRVRDICLGKATRLSQGVRIVDWRNAPISRLFYRYQEGEEYIEEMAGNLREGRVTARRTVHVEAGELLRVGTAVRSWIREGEKWTELTSQQCRLAGGQGAALRSGRTTHSRLGTSTTLRASKHLPDIAALIDPEQFELITGPKSGVVVLRGSAGTGKTTVALHRISYLYYSQPHRFRPEKVLVMVWGRAMRDYVAHVLPALGVEGVRVTTWEQWARTLVKRHYSQLPNQIADDTPEPVSRIKLHPGISELLAARARNQSGPAKAEDALQDWASVITDRNAIAQVMGNDITPGALNRAVDWCTAQQSAIADWLDGDRDVDARLDPEDDALLLRAWQLRVGPLRAKRRTPMRIAHLVLDEVQDFSPVEVQVLLDTTGAQRSVTLAGDTRQQISLGSGFSSWSGFLERIGIPVTALNTLEVSYRSTHPITRFAIEVLGETDEPPPRTMRDGPPVELFRFSDHGACVAFLSEALKHLVEDEPLANVALLTPDMATAVMYHDGLTAAELVGVRLVQQQRFAFAPGIDVVEADQIKGLEFDYVIIVEASANQWPDTPHHRRLMHVASTRAVHQLWLTSVGTPSSILPQATRR